MIRTSNLWLFAALLLTNVTYAATPDDITQFFCARAALFSESFADGRDANKSQQDSVASAAAKVNSTFKKQVDDTELRLLFPWAALADKLHGAKPFSKGSYVAAACMAALRDRIFIPLAKPEVQAEVRSLLDACEEKGSREEIGRCIHEGFTSLPQEKLDK